jgi:hypothetical protein
LVVQRIGTPGQQSGTSEDYRSGAINGRQVEHREILPRQAIDTVKVALREERQTAFAADLWR